MRNIETQTTGVEKMNCKAESLRKQIASLRRQLKTADYQTAPFIAASLRKAENQLQNLLDHS